MTERFSDRYRYRGKERDITIRENAPDALRFAIPLIAQDTAMAPNAQRQTFCEVLLVRPDPMIWSDYPNVWEEVNGLISQCEWFKDYDIAEGLHASINVSRPDQESYFQHRLHQFLRENRIGLTMTDGKFVYHGVEPFTETTQKAREILFGARHNTAANEMREALEDISRQPIPDLTGAIQHAVAALECTAREVAGKPNQTLGRLVPHLDLTPALNKAVQQLWGYASDRARHVREGANVSPAEAELVVSVACAVCTFLLQKVGKDGGA